ncbi:hypothetical protein NDU88_007221, partial [Pleurodeles waltl]
ILPQTDHAALERLGASCLTCRPTLVLVRVKTPLLLTSDPPSFQGACSVKASFVTGTACCDHISPLRIWSLESGQLVSCLGTDFRRGAGVLDVSYETPFTLLSCGYDTFIRYWDLRSSTRKCVIEWEEPHDSALYCLQSDGNQMIASGSSYYGVVRLWDKRATRCLQVTKDAMIV